MAIEVKTIKDYPKCGGQHNINMKAYGESDYWKELDKRKGKKRAKTIPKKV